MPRRPPAPRRLPRPPPRKAPSQERSRQTVEAILRAATRVLVREGWDRTSTNRVAEVAGISVGSLYQYFPNKEALVTALADRHAEAMWAVYAAKVDTLRDAPIRVAVQDLVETHLRAHAVDPDLHRVLLEQVPRMGGRDRIQEVQQRVTALVQLYLEARKDDVLPGDLALAAFVLVSVVDGVAHAAVLDRPALLADGALARETTALVLRYLGVSP